MLNKILGTATLIVVAWLSIQLLQTRQILRGVQLQVSSVSAEVREDLESTADDSARLNKDVMSQLGEMQAAQSALSKQVAQAKQSQGGDPKKLKAKDQEIDRLNTTISLKNAHSTILEAELLAHQKEGEKAAELLLSTKTPIWKLSDKIKDSKDALRGLMAPVDIQASQWKRGEFDNDAGKIRRVLLDVLSAQEKKS